MDEIKLKIENYRTILDFVRLADFYILRIRDIDKCIDQIKVPGILNEGLAEIEVKPIWRNDYMTVSVPNNVLIKLLLEAKDECVKNIDRIYKEMEDFKLETGI